MDIFKKLFQAEEVKVVAEPACIFSAPERPVLDYSEKASRAEAVNYRAIGSTTYGSGQPPVLYNDSIAAVQTYPIVYGCITAISEAISSLNVKVYSVKGAERTEELDHPFYYLYQRPNPHQGSFEFLEDVQNTLDTMGNAFLAIEKGPTNSSGYELYNLNPKYMAIIPDPKNKIKEYRFYINGITVRYKPEEIIHIKYSNVDDPYYGQPPLKPALEVLKIEKSRISYAQRFFSNNAVPSGVLETDSNLGESLLKKLRRDWNMLHRGLENSNNIAVLQGGLKFRSVSSPLKDLDFGGLKQLTKEEVLTIYKVPESVLGAQGGTGSSEGKEALTTFWRGTLVPRLKRLESAINRGLAKQVFSDGAFAFEFDLTSVEALQEDKETQAKYLAAMVGSSVLTSNEARAVLGYPRSDDKYADALMASSSFFGNQLMPVSEALENNNAGGAGSNQEKPTVKPKPKK